MRKEIPVPGYNVASPVYLHHSVPEALRVPQVKSRESILFGEFELDCRTAELRRNGTELKLQPQPQKSS